MYITPVKKKKESTLVFNNYVQKKSFDIDWEQLYCNLLSLNIKSRGSAWFGMDLVGQGLWQAKVDLDKNKAIVRMEAQASYFSFKALEVTSKLLLL